MGERSGMGGGRGGMGGGRGGMGGEGWDHEIKRRRIELEKLTVQWFLPLFPFPSLQSALTNAIYAD